MLLHAGHQRHDRSCGKSYWSGSWPQSLAAKSAKWPQGSSGTRRLQTWRRSSGPSRSKFCGRVQFNVVALEKKNILITKKGRIIALPSHRFMVAASKLKMSKSQESSFSIVCAIRGGMSFNESGVIRWLGMWWGSGGRTTDQRGGYKLHCLWKKQAKENFIVIINSEM